MDKQDAIKCLKSMQQWIPDWDDREDGLSYWDAIDMAIAALSPPNEPLTLEQLRASPHGKIKDGTLQSICNRANEIACRPPEGEEE